MLTPSPTAALTLHSLQALALSHSPSNTLNTHISFILTTLHASLPSTQKPSTPPNPTLTISLHSLHPLLRVPHTRSLLLQQNVLVPLLRAAHLLRSKLPLLCITACSEDALFPHTFAKIDGGHQLLRLLHSSLQQKLPVLPSVCHALATVLPTLKEHDATVVRSGPGLRVVNHVLTLALTTSDMLLAKNALTLATVILMPPNHSTKHPQAIQAAFSLRQAIVRELNFFPVVLQLMHLPTDSQSVQITPQCIAFLREAVVSNPHSAHIFAQNGGLDILLHHPHVIETDHQLSNRADLIVAVCQHQRNLNTLLTRQFVQILVDIIARIPHVGALNLLTKAQNLLIQTHSPTGIGNMGVGIGLCHTLVKRLRAAHTPQIADACVNALQSVVRVSKPCREDACAASAPQAVHFALVQYATDPPVVLAVANFLILLSARDIAGADIYIPDLIRLVKSRRKMYPTGDVGSALETLHMALDIVVSTGDSNNPNSSGSSWRDQVEEPKPEKPEKPEKPAHRTVSGSLAISFHRRSRNRKNSRASARRVRSDFAVENPRAGFWMDDSPSGSSLRRGRGRADSLFRKLSGSMRFEKEQLVKYRNMDQPLYKVLHRARRTSSSVEGSSSIETVRSGKSDLWSQIPNERKLSVPAISVNPTGPIILEKKGFDVVDTDDVQLVEDEAGIPASRFGLSGSGLSDRKRHGLVAPLQLEDILPSPIPMYSGSESVQSATDAEDALGGGAGDTHSFELSDGESGTFSFNGALDDGEILSPEREAGDDFLAVGSMSFAGKIPFNSDMGEEPFASKEGKVTDVEKSSSPCTNSTGGEDEFGDDLPGIGEQVFERTVSGKGDALSVDLVSEKGRFGDVERSKSGRASWGRPQWSIWPMGDDLDEPRSLPNRFSLRGESGSLKLRE